VAAVYVSTVKIDSFTLSIVLLFRLRHLNRSCDSTATLV
jgi:hypothetical protein